MPRKAGFGHFQISEKKEKRKSPDSSPTAYMLEPTGQWFEGVWTARHAKQVKGAHSLVSCTAPLKHDERASVYRSALPLVSE